MDPSAPHDERPGRIRVLPEAVINKIAAGEVVERPASVVKELMENALDAGATQVVVTVGEGGKRLVAVLDNGAGMDEDDARLAIQRHATSKIRNEAELGRITTLGFRGEALASIAAVSRFELITCAEEAAGGTRITVEGGAVNGTGRVGFPRGTKVTVEELFCNTPARRKFLRTTATEFQHVQGAFLQLALANPGVHFRLTHNQRTLHDLPRCPALSERVYQLFGRALYEGMAPVAGRGGTFAYEGLISLPSHSQTSRRLQHLFVNGRHVRHAAVNHGVYQAYRTLLMKDRHPAYVLMLRLEPHEVDVNVHPAKTEVRLRNPQYIHTVLADTLHRQLMDTDRLRLFGAGKAASDDGDPAWQRPLPGLEPHGDGAAVAERAPQAVHDADGGRAAPPSLAAAPSAVAVSPSAPAAAPPSSHSAGGLRVNPFAGEGFAFQPLSGGPETAGAEPAGLLPEGMSVLCQFHTTYLLVQRGDSLLLVDQHAAHERILFEQYRTQFYEGRLVRERFLVPLTVELSPQNALLLEQYLPQWNKMGFEIEAFGRQSYLVRQVPALLVGKDLQALILAVLDELALFGKSGRLEEVFNEILERAACHGAIRAGMALSREEMEALVSQLDGLDVNLYCPHGRPVWVEIPLRELEKRFKRIV